MDDKKTEHPPALKESPPKMSMVAKPPAPAKPEVKLSDEGRRFERRLQEEFGRLRTIVHGACQHKERSFKCCELLYKAEKLAMDALLKRFGEEV